MRWTRYAGWANIVVGIAVGAGMVGVGLGIIGVLTGVAIFMSGVFMVWLASGWDKPIEDLSTLNKYGRPANAVVLAVEEEALDGAGGRTAKLKLDVAPVNESDFIVTRTVPLPGGRVPAVGETVTVKFDPQKRKNLILLEENYMVESPTAAAMRMMRGGAPPAVLTALLVLALAAPAGAAVSRVQTMPVSDVELAGASVVVESPVGGTRYVRVDPNGTPTILRTFTGVGGDDDECCQTFFSTDMKASSTQIAISSFYEAFAKGMLAQSTYNLQTAPVNGALSQLFECGGNHPYDVDGDRIAYLGDDCTEKSPGGARVVTRNLAAQGAPVVGSFPMTRQPNTLDLAGDFVALSGFAGQDPELVIYNTAGAEQYKLNHNFAEYALQSDGKLAVAQTAAIAAGGDCRIEWFSKAEPTPHRIDFCPRSGRIRMAGDQIAFDRAEPGTSVVSLNLTTLDGQRQAYTVFDPAGTLAGFDFDGARLAYGSNGCVQNQDVVWADDLGFVGDSPTVEGGPCTAAVETKNARATSKGIVRVRVRCPEGCNASVSLYKGKAVASRKPGTATIAPGGVKTIPVKLGTLRDVRRTGSFVYSARVSVEQRGTSSTRGFKGAVRVLRPK